MKIDVLIFRSEKISQHRSLYIDFGSSMAIDKLHNYRFLPAYPSTSPPILRLEQNPIELLP